MPLFRKKERLNEKLTKMQTSKLTFTTRHQPEGETVVKKNSIVAYLHNGWIFLIIKLQFFIFRARDHVKIVLVIPLESKIFVGSETLKKESLTKRLPFIGSKRAERERERTEATTNNIENKADIE